MTQAIVHIGTHKTGTTSIQGFMRANREAFALRGIGIPYGDVAYYAVNPNRNAHFMFRSVWNKLEPKREHPEDKAMIEAGLNDLRECLRRYPCILLSDEALWYRGVTVKNFWPEVRRFLNNRGISDVKVVVYFRRQDEFITSLWKEFVKSHVCESLTLQEYAKRKTPRKIMDYNRGLRLLEDTFGRDNITVRIYGYDRFAGGDIYHDFCDAIGSAFDDDLVIPEMELNPSLSNGMAELKRVANEVPTYLEGRNFLKNAALTLQTGVKDEVKGTLLGGTAASELVARYEEGNRRIGHDYFGLENASPFDPVDESTPKYNPSDSQALQSAVRLFTETIAEQDQIIRDLQKRIERLESVNRNALTLKVERKLRGRDTLEGH